jgi:hypothetical protein
MEALFFNLQQLQYGRGLTFYNVFCITPHERKRKMHVMHLIRVFRDEDGKEFFDSKVCRASVPLFEYELDDLVNAPLELERFEILEEYKYGDVVLMSREDDFIGLWNKQSTQGYRMAYVEIMEEWGWIQEARARKGTCLEILEYCKRYLEGL